MSFDLTNKNISDTFQNLLQQTGSSNQVFDLEGNQVNHINVTNVSASIIEIPDSSNQSGNKLHSRSGVLHFGDTSLEQGAGGGIDSVIQDSTPQLGGNLDLNDNQISGSGKISITTTNTNDFFLLKSGSLNSLKVNGEGVLQLGAFSFQPTAVKGGLYYDDNDDEFYAGKNN
tara:strand:+ start:181 stop:696 length:516 start_codon:yes stop_codon:yes gene_type:complete